MKNFTVIFSPLAEDDIEQAVGYSEQTLPALVNALLPRCNLTSTLSGVIHSLLQYVMMISAAPR